MKCKICGEEMQEETGIFALKVGYLSTDSDSDIDTCEWKAYLCQCGQRRRIAQCNLSATQKCPLVPSSEDGTYCSAAGYERFNDKV